MRSKKALILLCALIGNILCAPYIVKAMDIEDSNNSDESSQPIEGFDKEGEQQKAEEIIEVPEDNSEREQLDIDTVEIKSNEETEIQEEENNEEIDTEKSKDIDDNKALQSKRNKTEENSTNIRINNITTKAMPILQNGVTDNRVIKLKKNLAKLGFSVPGNGTSYYGKQTEATVKRFQEYYGVNDTAGVAGNATLAKIEEILSCPLQKGKRDAKIITLKKNLKTLGFPVPGNTTSYFGSGTEQKVKEFQMKYGLAVNGIADPVTLQKIEEIGRSVEPSTLQIGVRDNRVIELKTNLARLGFPVPGNGTSYYGKQTETSVKRFQEYYGVNDTAGVAGNTTLAKIKEILSSPLQKGKRDARTITLKKNLKILGFRVPGNMTNYYGSETEQKVKEFQKEHGLIVNGIADPVVLNKIDEMLHAPLSKGMRREDVKTLKINLKKLGFTVPGNTTTYFGEQTERKVKDFQAHYKLSVNGKANQATLTKIKQVLSSPLQSGKRHKDVVKLKENLGKLGFKVPGNGTNYYGAETAKKVREFQKANRLPISGIADEITLAKIAEKVNVLPGNKEEITYTKYAVTLEQALNIQMNQLQQTDKYRNEAAFIHTNYADITEYGEIYSAGDVNLRTEPYFKENVETKVKNGTKITILGEVKGDLYAGNTKWYKVSYNKKTLYVHSSLVISTGMTAKTSSKVNVRAKSNTTSHIYGTLPKGSEVTVVKKSGNWLEIKYNTWRNPTRADVAFYLNPNNNDMFQHLLLSASVGVPAKEINQVLVGKGKLEGLGQAFIDGGKRHSVNEIYLISHAFLETGHGTSILSNGEMKVGVISTNKYVSVQPKGTYIVEYNPTSKTWSIKTDSKNESKGVKVRTVYNMFGIGAEDSNPSTLGSIRAYKEGWFTPESAIIGGAKFIGDRYIHNYYKQNTLYKMRWNPASPGYPQYATDIAWADKQVNQIKNMYGMLKSPTLKFDIAQYK